LTRVVLFWIAALATVLIGDVASGGESALLFRLTEESGVSTPHSTIPHLRGASAMLSSGPANGGKTAIASPCSSCAITPR